MQHEMAYRGGYDARYAPRQQHVQGQQGYGYQYQVDYQHDSPSRTYISFAFNRLPLCQVSKQAPAPTP